MKTLATTAFILLTLILNAQNGDFLLTHHSYSNSNIDNSNFDIISDQNGLICVANRNGILKYDGDAWNHFETPSASLSLALDNQNNLYIGGINQIGKLSLNDNKVIFQSLINEDSIQDLFLQTIVHNNYVYFAGNNHLAIHNIAENRTWYKEGDFYNLYVLDSILYINSGDNTYQIERDSLISHTSKEKVASVHHYPNRPPLVVNFDGKLSVWQSRFKPIAHNKIIEENDFKIVNAKWINDSLIACATNTDGVIILNYNDSQFSETVDYHSGLPDNEILAMHTDGKGGLWIAHPFGLTSVSPLFPAFSYSNFPGLKGNLTGIFQHDETLWITTSLGLFYFKQDTIFENQVYYKRKARKVRKVSTAPVQNKTATPKNEEKPFLKGLFNKKKRAKDQEKVSAKSIIKNIRKRLDDFFETEENVSVINKKSNAAQYERRVRKVPVKINYAFEQVEGTDGKYFDLFPYKNKLLLVGNYGIYEISDYSSQLIIDENIRSVTTTSSGRLLISTTDLQLKSYYLTNDVWIQEASLPFDDIIVNIKEDKKDRIWMAGTSHVYQLGIGDSTLRVNHSYELNNQYLDDVEIVEKADTVYFINSQGYFYYDEATDFIKENNQWMSSLSLPKTSLYDPVSKGTWIYNSKNWWLIPQQGAPVLYEYLRLFDDVLSITKDTNSNQYWLLTKDNTILKYDASQEVSLADYHLFVKNLSNTKGNIDPLKKFTLSYDENFLSVELSKPDYLGLLDPEFQYKLTGLNTAWSDWTKTKSIDFSYLPAGQYSLQLRSRDAFGKIEEAKNVLQFTVKDPYWKSPWFYALQIAFFGSLVFISSRLNQSNSTNRILSGGLSVLTLVLIIEFIQSAAGALLPFKSTPLIDFAVDVSVAILIFPIEKLLRDLMFREKSSTKKKKEKVKLKSAQTT